MMVQKIVKYILLSFLFVTLVVMVVWGVQWFSLSLEGLLIHKTPFFTSSLQGPVDDAKASMAEPALVHTLLFPARNPVVGDLALETESALSVQVWPGRSEMLFQKDADKKLSIASLTKLMTVLIVMEQYDLFQGITIDQQALNQEGEQGDLKLGQVLSVKDLLYITLMESSNRSAYALSELMGTDNFVILMNEKAESLGLTNTHFQDVSGLDGLSYSTAQDLAKLTEYVFGHYPLFRQIISLKEYNLYLPDGTFHHTLQNTNILLGQDNIIGGKTGYTKQAMGCFMAIQQGTSEGNYIINIVLGSQDRFGDMEHIINWVNTAYQWQ